MGVWIEITKYGLKSLPSFVTPCVGVWIEICQASSRSPDRTRVTPCVGVWIEILFLMCILLLNYVTPCVGVWIEIPLSSQTVKTLYVTPCVGVWIEIVPLRFRPPAYICHSLRGSVD